MFETSESLLQAGCEACRPDAPKLSPAQLQELMQHIPDWEWIVVDDVQQLQKIFQFPNFVAALDFANLVGDIAEEQGHHPALLVEWGKVSVRWWTHKIGGLHKNDVIMAAKTDALYGS